MTDADIIYAFDSKRNLNLSDVHYTFFKIYTIHIYTLFYFLSGALSLLAIA